MALENQNGPSGDVSRTGQTEPFFLKLEQQVGAASWEDARGTSSATTREMPPVSNGPEAPVGAPAGGVSPGSCGYGDARRTSEGRALPRLPADLRGSIRALWPSSGRCFACVLVLGVTGNLTRGVGSVTLGSGTDTTINVQGEDNTLAETVAEKDILSVVCIYVYTKNTASGFFGNSASDTETESSLGSGRDPVL